MVTVTELPRLGNWYGPEPPALGEDVMCRMIEQSVVSGITVELPEYSNLQCVVPVSQLPRKKNTLHKMMKYLRKDQERGRDAFFIARVYSIEDSTGEVTLTVTCWRDRTANDRRVRDEEFAECKRRFNEAKTLLKIVKRLYAHRDNEDWQIKFMHPLYSEDNEMEPMEFIEAALVKPNLMEQLSIAPEDRPFVIDAIIATIGMNKIAKLAWRIDFRMRDKSLLELQMAMEAAARVAPPQHGRVRQVKVEYHGEMIIATAVCPHRPDMVSVHSRIPKHHAFRPSWDVPTPCPCNVEHAPSPLHAIGRIAVLDAFRFRASAQVLPRPVPIDMFQPFASRRRLNNTPCCIFSEAFVNADKPGVQPHVVQGVVQRTVRPATAFRIGHARCDCPPPSTDLDANIG